MQIKTAMKSHFTPVSMVNIKKSTDNKCWRRRGEEGIRDGDWCSHYGEQNGGSLKS